VLQPVLQQTTRLPGVNSETTQNTISVSAVLQQATGSLDVHRDITHGEVSIPVT
jgi:hypothetical protein